MCYRKTKSHLNSRTFSRFSRLSRLKANALFSLTSKSLGWFRSSLSISYWSVRSNLFILSSIAVNLCFILCCSENTMAMQDSTTRYRTQRRISGKRSLNLCSFLSCSMRCRWNFNGEEIWPVSSFHNMQCILQPQSDILLKWPLSRPLT